MTSSECGLLLCKCTLLICDVSEDVLPVREGRRQKKRKKDATKAPLSFALDEDEESSHSTSHQPKGLSSKEDTNISPEGT